MKDINGLTPKEGDKVRGFGYITFNDGFKIDRTTIVTVRVNNGIMMFGALSAKSFPRFEILQRKENR